MNAEQQQGSIVPGDGDTGGTRGATHVQQQTFTAVDSQRALTDQLMEQVCDPKNLVRAYRRVRSNKGKPGVDGMTVHELADWLRQNHAALTASLLDGTYQPQPVRGVQIPKPGGGQRQLGIPVAVDRLVQQTILQVLNPILDPTFSNSSYGFRPGRGQQDALDALWVGMVRKRVNWILDLDIRSFFDKLQHDWLVQFVEHRIGDKRVVRLIRKWLKAGVMEDGEWSETKEGSPQGSVISPILANLYLHYVLDLWVVAWRKKQMRGEVIGAQEDGSASAWQPSSKISG